MFRAIIIGNLGADAHVEANNGRPFVSFSVGHNDRFTRPDGTVVETTQWISCALNGSSDNLLPYLKKGKQVYVEGRCRLRCYSSEKERRFVAGANISVDHLELIGGSTDDVPRTLHDENGVMRSVKKAYFIEEHDAKEVLNGRESACLMTASGEQFILTAPCWVTKIAQAIEDKQEEVKVFGEENLDSEAKEMQSKLRESRKK